ncbi:MAG: hypothetical protein MJY74_08205 [Bacteroidaceae bacterium]|nr:hypothetical protein [Bacteroidaceae bacterium]
MKRLIFITILLQLCVACGFSQTEDLFTWENNRVVPKAKFTATNQPNEQDMSMIVAGTYLHKTIPVSSSNGQYNIYVETRSESDDVDFDEFYVVRLFDSDKSSVLLSMIGAGFFTTTRWLSKDPDDLNLFIQVPLDENSYALIFAGWYWYPSVIPGEMIIVVINKNEATLVYDGAAASISSNGYTLTPDSFSMDFVSNLSGLVLNEITDQFEEVGEGLSGKTKYTLYKEGAMLKIRTWQ